MKIDANFECGNIDILDIKGNHAELAIRKDTNAHYYQWFCFRVTGDAGVERQFTIANASTASYPKTWEAYDVLASYDGQTWWRVPTQYDGKQLSFEHQAETERTMYAFFVPYFARQREALLKDCDESPLASVQTIGHSPLFRPIEQVIIGQPASDRKVVWIVSRQHAGEPMAEWATEGLIRRLLDTEDYISRNLLEKAVFYIIPNMNPDGSYAGNLRANANGVDLNRAWDKPSPDCPEIVAVRDTIAQTGVDYFFDIHGDEERPFVWIVGPQVEISDELQKQQKQFDDALSQCVSQVQPPPQSLMDMPDDLGMSADYITATYHCPAWIIELPFKAVPDDKGNPDSLLAEGCLQFGRDCVEALHTLIVN